MERLVPLLPILVAATLISGWMVWRRHDPEIQQSWQPIILIVVRQLLLFAVIGAVVVYPRSIPVVFTGVLAAFAVWWWLRNR